MYIYFLINLMKVVFQSGYLHRRRMNNSPRFAKGDPRTIAMQQVLAGVGQRPGIEIFRKMKLIVYINEFKYLTDSLIELVIRILTKLT